VPNIKEYLRWEQVPLVLAFVAWWLLGAGWLLLRFLRAKAGQRRQSLGPCVLGMFLAGLASVAVGVLTFMLVLQIGKTPESDRAFMVPAVILGLLVAAPTAILVLYATFQLPLGRLLAVSWPALLSVVVAAGALGAPAVWLSLDLQSCKTHAHASVAHLHNIDSAIREYQRYFDNQPPPNLLMLTEEMSVKSGKSLTFLKRTELVGPFLPDANVVGYFYYPCPSDNGKTSKVLRACEWTHPRSNQYRAMLFANGEAFWNSDQEFQSMLKLPENAEFTRQFRAADANRR
jgi:hypothetical protein